MQHATFLAAATLLAASVPCQLTAAFTATPTTGPTPLIVNFTDSSTTSDPGGITSWAWDLDGDGITDSTSQHPTWVYGHCGSYTVALTVSDATHAPTTLTRVAYVRAGQSLGTLTNGNTSFGAGGGNFLDVTVHHAQGILVCSIDTKTTAAANTPIAVEVYWTANTYVGVQQVPTAWRLIATGTGTGTGSLQPPVPVTLSNPFYLPAGSHGLFVRLASGGGPQYTQGTGQFANADLTITTGASQATPFTSAPATPRTWNGVFYYATCGSGGEAGLGLFATGCAGSAGVTTQRVTAMPWIGQTASVTLDHLPSSVAILMFGLSRTNSPFGPLPVAAAPYGAPGCNGLVSPDANSLLLGGGGTATWNLAIPNAPGMSGLAFYTQALVLDPGFNALGAVFSDGAAGILGM